MGNGVGGHNAIGESYCPWEKGRERRYGIFRWGITAGFNAPAAFIVFLLNIDLLVLANSAL